uniref:Exportin-T n=2 Tax=Schistocephalus solidus TaxID=70667 RepID=A0A0V0JB42_SCHSO
MSEIMTSICDSSISSIDYFPVQLNFFEIIGRYDKFFNTHPKLLLNVLVAFLDERGLRNPRVNVRCRCAYLFSRLVKSHRNTLAPHAEQILQQLEGLLPLDPTPELQSQKTVGLENGTTKLQSNGIQNQKFLSITEQSFLYESSAHLILASALRSATSNGDGGSATDSQASHLFAMLLRPIMIQFPELVRLLAVEKDPIVAEPRGVVVKQAADLITRTTRVMSSQSPLNPEFIPLFMDILNVMVNSMAYLPTAPGSPGRGAACTGIRAYLHRLIVCIGPDCTVPCQQTKDGDSNGGLSNASEWLMLAISSIMPQLIGVNQDGTALVEAAEADIDQRWRELRDNMPLFNQIALRYKERSLPFLTACLPPLVGVTLNALSEPLHETQFVAMDERKCLRRNFLQMLQGVSQVLPQGLLVALGSNAANVLMSIVALTDACLAHDDAVGMKSGFAFFTAIVPVCAQETAFYEGFILSHLLPLCFLLPARSEFRLTDAQFVLALNESVGCIHVINSVKGQVFQDFLQGTFLPQQNLSAQYIESYVNNLRSNSLAEFQVFAKNFYSSFR